MDLFLHIGGILVTAVLAAVLPTAFRRGLLLLAAVLLYGAIDWRFPLILFVIVLGAYGAALWLGQRKRGAGAILGACALVLTPLAIYKYLPVWFDGIERILPISDLNFGGYGAVIVPVGLSFYSFVCCGYLVDVHRRVNAPDGNLARLALFVSFYPALLSGPIERYRGLAGKLWDNHRPTPDMVLDGLLMIAYGLFLKEVVGDRLGGIVDAAYSAGAGAGASGAAWGFVCFVMQLLADFGGYSLIAIGAGNLFGVSLTVNFRQPLFAESLVDFWQRWHISLTRWIGDYVYRPTALLLVKHAKLGRWWTEAIVSYVTWIAMGLWHGAEATFVLFGAVQATAMVAYKSMPRLPDGVSGILRRLIATLATVFFVVLSFGIIRAGSIEQYASLLGALLSLAPAVVKLDISSTAVIGSALMMAVQAVAHWRPESRLRSVPLRATLIFGFVIAALLMGRDDARDFIYFRF